MKIKDLRKFIWERCKMDYYKTEEIITAMESYYEGSELSEDEITNVLYENLSYLVNGRVFCIDLAKAIISARAKKRGE